MLRLDSSARHTSAIYRRSIQHSLSSCQLRAAQGSSSVSGCVGKYDGWSQDGGPIRPRKVAAQSERHNCHYDTELRARHDLGSANKDRNCGCRRTAPEFSVQGRTVKIDIPGTLCVNIWATTTEDLSHFNFVHGWTKQSDSHSPRWRKGYHRLYNSIRRAGVENVGRALTNLFRRCEKR